LRKMREIYERAEVGFENLNNPKGLGLQRETAGRLPRR
jgi:hypothetical protein